MLMADGHRAPTLDSQPRSGHGPLRRQPHSIVAGFRRLRISSRRPPTPSCRHPTRRFGSERRAADRRVEPRNASRRHRGAPPSSGPRFRARRRSDPRSPWANRCCSLSSAPVGAGALEGPRITFPAPCSRFVPIPAPPERQRPFPVSRKGPLSWFFTWWRGEDLNL
jgi:hypothetical protein